MLSHPKACNSMIFTLLLLYACLIEASLLTGRMPSLHGLRYNGCNLPANANTFVDVLAEAGYDSAAIERATYRYLRDCPSWHAKRDSKRLIEEALKPDGNEYGQESPESYKSNKRFHIQTPYYGFGHVDMVTRHGDRCGGHYEQWFRATVDDWRELWDDSNELPHNYTCPQAFRTPVPEELYPTAWIADRAIEYLAEPERRTNPFFSFVSFPDPHHPFNPSGQVLGYVRPRRFRIADPVFRAQKSDTADEVAGGKLSRTRAPVDCSDRDLPGRTGIARGDGFDCRNGCLH